MHSTRAIASNSFTASNPSTITNANTRATISYRAIASCIPNTIANIIFKTKHMFSWG